MDPPQTRREKKKDQAEKAQGKNGKYTAKRIRQFEILMEKTKNGNKLINNAPRS